MKKRFISNCQSYLKFCRKKLTLHSLSISKQGATNWNESLVLDNRISNYELQSDEWKLIHSLLELEFGKTVY